ncbi:MAG: M23 family metallopeptidase [Clostridiales Family XIII bacterium]|jgi:murein DD-endopeptidase MepM/ murein hydrolase activator NlpD|nr:M23 family metallopeptidase [Clostridiales Family XIII bacterium]
MKIKTIVVLVIVVCALALCGLFAWNIYEGTGARDIPVTPVRVAGQELLPTSADCMVPVFGGLLQKHVRCLLNEDGTWWVVPTGAALDMADPAGDFGEIGEAPYSLSLGLPETMGCSVTLSRKDAQGETPVFANGAISPAVPGYENKGIVIEKAGEYTLSIEGALAGADRNAVSGTYDYRVYFSVKNPDPVFKAGRTELAQGDILSLKLENVPEGTVPEIESELGPAIFAKGAPQKSNEAAGSSGAAAEGAEGTEASAPAGPPEGFANWYAAVPIGNERAPGEYPVKVSAGDLVYETSVTVTKYEFDFQNLIIDTSIPSVAAAVSGEAIAQFRETITPLFSQFSDEVYWDGLFAQPVELGTGGFISTQFGEIRITNGDQNTRRSHYGMDFAVSTGTPVHAGGAGQVLVAAFLLNTGNTVVIDHGGGLKSFYYHMDSLDAEAGALVRRGDLIGRVGTTGYSTGPHLHYEMRIGDQAVSPSALFEPGAGLYSAE